MIRRLTSLTLVVLFALAVGFTSAAEPTQGNPKIQSIESLAFSPEGLLLIGDGRGGQIVAVHTDDRTPTQWGKLDEKDLKQQIATRLNAKVVDVVRFVVHPVSHRAYLAVRADGQDRLVTIDGTGAIAPVDLTNVKHTRHPLSSEAKAPAIRINDLTYADGQALVTASAKGKVNIYTVDLAREAAPNWVSAESYHIGHGRWETNAPMRSVIPYTEKGKKFLVGVFTCTPIVKYPLDELKVGGGQLKGTSVIELGGGTTPLDMFVYEKEGNSYILMNLMRNNAKLDMPTAFSALRVEQGILTEEDGINEKAPRRGKQSKRAQVAPEYAGVVAMDRLGTDRALVIRTDEKAVFRLAILPLP